MARASTLALHRPATDLLGLLGHGEPHAIRGEFLAATLGISERALRDSVEYLRREGQLIGSSARGYFLIRSWEELEATARQLRSRALAMLATKQALEHAAVERFGEAALTLFSLDEVG